MNRPKPGETEEDILRMQEKFLLERAKNPNAQPAAQIVKIEKREFFYMIKRLNNFLNIIFNRT